MPFTWAQPRGDGCSGHADGAAHRVRPDPPIAILQPGTRSYNRSWIRDGAMMAEGLNRLGMAEHSADYLRWYAPYVFENGKVPCCVDARGADPVPENDSHGEFVFLAAEAYRYGGDAALLRQVWPQVQGAIRYMDELRASTRTAEFQTAETRHLFGLLPPTISHEGYSAKAMHSYWDDFWGLLGYKDAVFIAETLGDAEVAARYAAARDQFAADIRASIRATATTKTVFTGAVTPPSEARSGTARPRLRPEPRRP